MSNSFPSEAKVVIIGGGIAGASVAYHLTQFGWKDVVLLEQNTLAGGTTWHAAGLVGRLRTSNSLTRINKYSAELYARLEKETGHHVGWKQVGSLIVAKSEARMIQLRRTAAMSEWFGVEVQMIGAAEAGAKWPLLRVDDVLGAAWLPHDGKVLPKEVALALTQGAKNRGAQVFENTRVREVTHRDGRANGVITNLGRIKAEYVVLCGGMWTRELGLQCGVTIPLYPVEHHYVVTEPIEGAFDELPVGRDPDLCLYFRGEGNALMLGAFQAESKPWLVDRVPSEFSFQLLDPDWEKFSAPLRDGKHRIPALNNCKFAKFVNGPESFTPDNNFLMGETPELRNLFVAAGFNSVGIASSGGAGKYLAEWMIEGQPTMDLWSVDIRRFGAWANNREFLRTRVVEVLGLHYQAAWPNREPEAARGIRRTPLHERLALAGACFGVKNGWERPNWFARSSGSPEGLATRPEVQYGFCRQNWFYNHAFEHQAARERVALFDQSGFGKLSVQGRDAVTLLQRLCGQSVDVAPGAVVYTGMFNERGGFESDLTVMRVSGDEYYLITGTSQPYRDADWIRRHVEPGESVAVTDVTNSFGVLGVMGPNARTLLQRVTDSDLSNEAFPFGSAQTISIGKGTARAVRITYVGELGWELHVSVDQLAVVYDALVEAGLDLSITDAGHYAINSLRLEKGYRAWGAELSPDDTALEAGLGFAIGWNKEFIGRKALAEQKANGVKRRLAIFTVDDPEPVLWGSELIYRDDRPAGYTTSGSYAFTLGRAIGMGYVNHASAIDRSFLLSGRYEINISGRRYQASVHLQAPFDPQRTRVLA